jgi:hypothetical protein
VGNFNNFIDRGGQANRALHYVVGDADFSVDVFRHGINSASAGFISEVNKEQYYNTINVRVDMRGLTAGETRIGLTDTTTVRKGDIWRYTDMDNNIRYWRVTEITPQQAVTAVELEDILWQ